MLAKRVDLYSPPPPRQKQAIMYDLLVYRHIPGAPGAIVSLRNDELFVGERRVGLYLTDEQRRGESVPGEEVYKRLLAMGDVFPNVNLCQFLVGNPEFIPRVWRQKDPGYYHGCGLSHGVYCFGTIFALDSWLGKEDLVPYGICGLDFGDDRVCNPSNELSLRLQRVDTGWCKTEAIAYFVSD